MKTWILTWLLLTPACSSLRSEIPAVPPPLVDMEEPLDAREEPTDEATRLELPTGSFTGLVASRSSDSLDELAADSGGLLVAAVVENSPADLAGVVEGDALVEVRRAGRVDMPRWPSEWRAIELDSAAGTSIEVVLDRAGVERAASIVTIARARSAARENAERFREEDRVGVVLRTASEVEARAAGLAPGGGAVVTGLSIRSPWRARGVRFGDLVRAVDGEPVGHPQVVLDAIRKADEDSRLALDIVRDGGHIAVSVGVSRRESEVTTFSIPFLFSYSNDRGRAETSVLFGLFAYESTPAAWRMHLVWFIEFGGGDADRLEVESTAPSDASRSDGSSRSDDAARSDSSPSDSSGRSDDSAPSDSSPSDSSARSDGTWRSDGS